MSNENKMSKEEKEFLSDFNKIMSEQGEPKHIWVPAFRFTIGKRSFDNSSVQIFYKSQKRKAT